MLCRSATASAKPLYPRIVLAGCVGLGVSHVNEDRAVRTGVQYSSATTAAVYQCLMEHRNSSTLGGKGYNVCGHGTFTVGNNVDTTSRGGGGGDPYSHYANLTVRYYTLMLADTHTFPLRVRYTRSSQ